jgi:hypothetical protein
MFVKKYIDICQSISSKLRTYEGVYQILVYGDKTDTIMRED